MITEGLLGIVLSVLHAVMGIVPDIDITVPADVAASAVQYLNVAFYVLPMGTVFTICSILVLLQVFRIAVSIIKTIWSLLPLV